MLWTRVKNCRFSMRLLGTFVTKRNIKVKKKMPISVSSLRGSILCPHRDNQIRQTNLDFNLPPLFQEALQTTIIDLTEPPDIYQNMGKVTGSYKM